MILDKILIHRRKTSLFQIYWHKLEAGFVAESFYLTVKNNSEL